ncbi:MAG: tetratricopeptide repeat protein [Dissulfurispiraceae bacterium]|jgi:tetratricopeptide (TPR) repeat protein|nr:tetratricopeptide repeat protein [Dissulfurispiraceae bacterium]
MAESRFIETLRERISNEPGSRLFLTLAEELIKRDLHDEAANILERGLAASPDFAGAHLTLAGLYALKKDYQKAIYEYSEAKRIFPSSLTALRGIAAAYKDHGDMDAAADAYREVLLLDPLDQQAAEFIEIFGAKTVQVIEEPEVIEVEHLYTDQTSDIEIIDQTEQFNEQKNEETIGRLSSLLDGIKRAFALSDNSSAIIDKGSV